MSGRGPGAGREKRRARANYVCAIPRALASPFDPGRHSYEKSPREIPEAAVQKDAANQLRGHVRVRVLRPGVDPQAPDEDRP